MMMMMTLLWSSLHYFYKIFLKSTMHHWHNSASFGLPCQIVFSAHFSIMSESRTLVTRSFFLCV